MHEINFLESLHKATKRDYLARMNAEKPECMRVAKQFDKDYWDGDRKHGYGGYKYDGRWKPVARDIAGHYGLPINAKILDVGCGKGHLLSEFKGLCFGIDISKYALQATENRDTYLTYDNCTSIPWADNYFNFVYSINTLHNLCYADLKLAIREIVRVMRDKAWICVESYRNEEELTNLQAWQLTCLSYYSPDDWRNILIDNGYRGDVGFVYFS